MNYNFKIRKFQWEQQIRKEYERYQNFINNTNMPQYEIVFIDRLDGVPYAMETLTYRRPIVLNVNVGYMLSGAEHCQPALFHEFTHIWDSENLFIDKDDKERKAVLSLYSEYHASQIGFLRFIEFDSINETRTIAPNDSFYEFTKKETVLDYYNERCKLLVESINNYNSKKTTLNYKAVIDSYMYVFGIKSMYDKYIANIELPQVESIFHENINQLYPLLQNIEIEKLWNTLLLCSQVLDKLHILNTLEVK